MVDGISWAGLALRALKLAAAAYAGFALFAWVYADRLVFQPHPSSGDEPAGLVRIPTTGGDTLAAVWLPNPTARHAILFSHGNAEDLGDLGDYLEALRDAGFSVLAWDYRGYGLSTGRPGERATYRDAEAAFAHLTGPLGVPAERVIVHGRSLGGGAATYLAATRPVGGVVLESTFTSIFAVFPGVRLFPFDRFRSGARIRRVRAPVLVIHGTEDEVVPFAHGRALYDRAPGPRRHLWVDGAGHGDVLYVAGGRYFDALAGFAAGLPRPGDEEG